MSIHAVGSEVIVTVNGVPGFKGVIIGCTVMKDTPTKYVVTYVSENENEQVTDWFDDSMINAS